jgi:hypothetical protein
MSLSPQGETASRQDHAVSTDRTKRQSPLVGRLVIGGLLVLAIVVIAAYYLLSGFFNANGTWYGTMHVTSGSTTVSIETYMEVSTFFTGSLSGQGTFCMPLPLQNTATFGYSLTGQRAFTFPGHETQPPIALTAEYTVPLPLGISVPIGPSLTMHGAVANNHLQLTGGSSTASTSLDMRHGTKADFLAACKTLTPLG